MLYKGLSGIFIILLLGLQWQLWFGSQGILVQKKLHRQYKVEASLNDELKNRNGLLSQRIANLQSSYEVIEERAREDLGMIKEGEVYVQLFK